jgi:hypothetical protein
LYLSELKKVNAGFIQN